MTTLYLGEMSKGERQCRCCPHRHKFGWGRLTGIGVATYSSSREIGAPPSRRPGAVVFGAQRL